MKIEDSTLAFQASFEKCDRESPLLSAFRFQQRFSEELKLVKPVVGGPDLLGIEATQDGVKDIRISMECRDRGVTVEVSPKLFEFGRTLGDDLNTGDFVKEAMRFLEAYVSDFGSKDGKWSRLALQYFLAAEDKEELSVRTEVLGSSRAQWVHPESSIRSYITIVDCVDVSGERPSLVIGSDRPPAIPGSEEDEPVRRMAIMLHLRRETSFLGHVDEMERFVVSAMERFRLMAESELNPSAIPKALSKV